MKKQKEALRILVIIMVACLVMGLVDAVVRPGYLAKSALKLTLFLGLPYFLYYRRRQGEAGALFTWSRRSFYAVAMGFGVYGLILGGYFLLSGLFDFSMVTGALEGDLGVHAGNFVFVALYISFINSMLEEFFFRGFGFLTLRQYLPERSASCISAVAFALYHVSMLLGWFRWDLLTLLIVGLLAAGWVFNWCNRRTGTLWFSWFLHMFANFSINTVGFLLLGIL